MTGDGDEGLRLSEELELDIILLDLRMPKMGGIEVLKRLRERNVTTPVVMLTTSSDERDLIESLRCGAQGYLLKEMEPDDLVVALRDVVAGKSVVAPGLTEVLAKVVRQGDTASMAETASPFDDLTPREREILCHLSEGQSNKVIARNLGISDGTVKLHVKSILRKLDVHSRVEAAVMAVEQGLTHKQ
jgi:two-component system nitrate/nitrite response regulator NarL